MKLPVNGVWKVDQSRERGLNLLATKNINFDRDGVAQLANRTITLFDESDDATFTVPIGAYSAPALTQLAGTSADPFVISITTVPTTIAVSAAANRPSLSVNSSQTFYNSRWFISENGDLNSFDGTNWTAYSLSGITGGVRHALAVHKANNTIIMANGPEALQYDQSVVPSLEDLETDTNQIVGLAYNRNFIAAVTWDPKNREAWLYIWDGATSAANYAYPLGSNRAMWVIPWKNTFALLNGLGQLMQWTDAGLVQLAALPTFYTSAILASIDAQTDISHDTSVLIDGDKIFFNIKPTVAYPGSEPSVYNSRQPGGTWCFDPDIGLYHRHAPSGTKLLYRLSTSPNLTTNVLTVATGVPDTGTPCVYITSDGTPLGGTAINTIYYVIKLSATTFKLATTRANAAAGIAIDLTTDTAPSNEYKFFFFSESDFGQLSLSSTAYGGLITKTGPQAFNLAAAAFTIFQKFAYGFKDIMQRSISATTDVFGVVMDRGENRGWLMTQRMYGPNVTDRFQKLYLKARHIQTENDKVIVKYRVSEDVSMPLYVIGGTTYGTYTAGNQFTTTADLSAVKTAFDAGHAYELEITSGGGAGYLAHVTAITLTTGTYTVTLDETIRNVSIGDTFYFVFDNFEKMLTKTGAEGMNSTGDQNYTEFPISQNAAWIQLRVELRGYLVGLEEMDLVNSGDKPAL